MLLAPALAAQEQVLSLDSWFDGALAPGAPRVASPELEAVGQETAPASSFTVVPVASGVHHIFGASWDFEVHLILRDPDGRVLAEQGATPLAMPTLVAELQAELRYRLDVCARSGGAGVYELVWRRGPAPVGTAAERLVALEAEGREGSLVYAADLVKQADLTFQQGDYPRSEELLQRALEIRRQRLGPGHDLVATTLLLMGRRVRNLGRLEEATGLLQQAAAIWEDLGNASGRIFVQGDLARLHEERGDSEEAVRCYREALRLLVEDGLPGPLAALAHRTEQQLQNNLGKALRGLGRFEEARAAYERSLEVGGRHPEVLTNLAYLLAAEGDLARARALVEEALGRFPREGLERSPAAATAWTALGRILEQLRDLDEAEQAFRRGLEIRLETLGPEHPAVAESLGNLALIQDRRRDFEGALATSEAALEQIVRVRGADHPGTFMVRANIGGLLRKVGRLDEALARLEETCALASRTLGEGHHVALEVCEQWSHALWNAGKRERALVEARRAGAAERERLGLDHPEVTASARYRAEILLDMGRPGDAWDELLPALDALHARLDRELPLLADDERLTFVQHHKAAALVLLAAARASGQQEHARLAYEQVLAWKGRVSRSLMRSRARLVERIDEEGRRQLGRLRVVQDELARSLAGSVSGDTQALRQERDALVVSLARRAGVGEAGARPSVAALQERLPREGALVDLLIHPRHAVGTEEQGVRPESRWGGPVVTAWITRRDGPPVRVDLGSAAAMTAAVTAARDELAGGGGRGTSLVSEAARPWGAAQRLRERLWDPLAPHLVGADPVLVCPDGVLATYPFELLPEADGGLLVERHRFAYLQDATVLVELASRPERAAAPSMLAVGAVDYGQGDGAPPVSGASAPVVSSSERGTATWSPLPFTAVELDAIEATHASVFDEQGRLSRLEGRAATEARLGELMGGHDVVHVASHAYFDPAGARVLGVDPGGTDGVPSIPPGLLSGLVCAGASRAPSPGRGDGLLTAEEISWLDLGRVDLVVLSACETGLGRAEAGEGLMGLRRAFRLAGARTVISSLWSVGDASTATLMEGFYERLWRQGLGPGDALRETQLALLTAQREGRGGVDRRTWGAFVLEGDWR